MVGRNGRISLARFPYHVGVYLAGETVDILLREDRLLEIFHRGVLIAAHARRHTADAEPATLRHRSRRPQARPPRPRIEGAAVLRMVESVGIVSFAGTSCRVGTAYRGMQVEVRLVADTVEIWVEGKYLRTHQARHDPAKEHGAFATPGGRPRKRKAAS